MCGFNELTLLRFSIVCVALLDPFGWDLQFNNIFFIPQGAIPSDDFASVCVALLVCVGMCDFTRILLECVLLHWTYFAGILHKYMKLY